MPSTFREETKLCENCGEILKLNCSRDLVRKRFCSKSCNRSFTSKQLWKNSDFRELIVKNLNTPEVNLKKGHKREKHPFWGKNLDLNRKRKQSESLSESIISGKFNPHANHEHGYMYDSKFIGSKLFYRSSYEKRFLEMCITDDNIKSVSSSPWKILYNDFQHYIPDFLIEKQNKKILVEVKPFRRIYEYSNQLKFEAARKFCTEQGIAFEIFTEKNID